MLVRCGECGVRGGMKTLYAFAQLAVLVSLPLLLGGCGENDVKPVSTYLTLVYLVSLPNLFHSCA